MLRLPDDRREDVDALAATLIPTRSGAILPLRFLATISEEQRPSTINREWGRRLLKVSVTVRDRDVASFVEEARQTVVRDVKLPAGYFLEWGGQFENLERSQKRLAVVVPLTLSSGVGAEVQRPLATVVIGGVLTSTLLTLRAAGALSAAG